MISNQSSEFNQILKDNNEACEYSINQTHHCKPNNFFFLLIFLNFFFNENKWYLYTQQEVTQSSSNNQTINTPPNLKLTLSSMFKQMHVRTRYKSLNESTREKERKHMIL